MSKPRSAIQQKQSAASIPPPFTKASASLAPLLPQCDPSKVYILHIDKHAVEHKKTIFLIPVLLNGSIGLLLLWRIYAAAPTYWALILSMLRVQSSAFVDTTTTTRRQQIMLVLRRALLILLDFILFRFVGPWPLTFFAEQPENPVSWRWKLGFKTEEVIARVSRGWGAEDLMKGQKKGEESPWFKTRITPAIDKETMQKTGYLTMDRSWDLDFGLMLDAHTLLKQEKIKLSDVDGVALVHMDQPVGWCEWRWQTESAADAELRFAVDHLKAELKGSKSNKPEV